ncbi:hypothetical protein, partial [Paraburkholderia aspalathi]|uniref:hypothetical protein n=1 Tax=Paraburkholderia aspalathi TaxID=1324617 RepID=UPI0038BB42DF
SHNVPQAGTPFATAARTSTWTPSSSAVAIPEHPLEALQGPPCRNRRFGRTPDMEIQTTMFGLMDKITPATRHAGRNQFMIGEDAYCDLTPWIFAPPTALSMRRRKPIHTMFRIRKPELKGHRIGLSRR